MELECSAPKRLRIKENLNLDDSRFDDCWIHVFKHLPVKKRVILERVSQKWKTLVPYSDVHSLQLTEFTWPKSRRIEKDYCIDYPFHGVARLVPDDDLRHVLKSSLERSGPYLKELDFKLENGKRPRPTFRLSKDLMDYVIKNAPNLTKLNLTWCLLTLGCFPCLLNLGKLEKLDLGSVTITEEDGSSTVQDVENVKAVVGSTIQNLPSLKKLTVFLEMPIAPPVRNPNLTDLYVAGQKRTREDLLAIIQHCPNLEVLEIDGFAPDFRMAELGQLHQLRKLTLSFFSFSAEDMVAFSKGCPNMEKLQLNFSSAQANSLNELWRLRNLKCLALEPSTMSIKMFDSALVSVAKNRLLETLLLPYADLSDESLKNLAQYCPNLVTLNFLAVKGISDEGVKAILENCKNLKRLFLVDTKIEDPTLTVIGAMASSLIRVHLGKTRVTGDGIRSLFEEREKRVMNGEKLAKLEVDVDRECPIPKENLEAVSLFGIYQKVWL